jgi:hypothetical protein
MLERGLCLAAAYLLPALGVFLGRGESLLAEGLSRVATVSSRVHELLREFPAEVGAFVSVSLAQIGRLLADEVPARGVEFSQDIQRGVRAALRRRPGVLGIGGDVRAWACLCLVLLGWLYFKPGVATALPDQFPSFGGLHPRLRRAADPSRERMSKAAAQRNAALEKAGLSTEPQIERIERKGVFEPEVVPE